jgi:predicted lipoprotein
MHLVRHNLSVSLVVDRSQNPMVLDGEALGTWAQAHTVFVSSDMRDLRDERRALATEMKAMGLNVVMFEDLGGARTMPKPRTSTAWRGATSISL